jgi:hypothetical protein
MSRSSNEDPTTSSVAMLGEGSGQRFQGNIFYAAGKDVISTSNDVNATVRNINFITIGRTTPPSSVIDGMGHWQSILRSRFVQQILSVFQSTGNSDALRHGSQTQRILDILPPERAAEHGDSDVQAATNADHDSPKQPDHQSSPPHRSATSNSQQFHVVSVLSADFCRGI